MTRAIRLTCREDPISPDPDRPLVDCSTPF